MVIRKKFKFNGLHIVRNCSSERCKKSIHGHTYTVELFFSAKSLDNGQMIMDFGLMKNTIKEFVMSFNNSYSMWDKEDEGFKLFIERNTDRIIYMPMSPSAESYSLLFLKLLSEVMNLTVFNNGEHNPKVPEDIKRSKEAVYLGWRYYYKGDSKTAMKRFMLCVFAEILPCRRNWAGKSPGP